MESKLLLLAIVMSSWVFSGFSRQLLAGTTSKMVCMQRLMPCQSFMKSPSSPPSVTCCTPLKDMVEKDKECLCDVFNNVDLLKSFNVTQEEALKLPKACGVEADISQCDATKNATTSAASPTAAVAPTTTEGSSTPSTDTPKNSTENGTSTAHGLLPLGRSAIVLTSIAASMSILI